MVPPAPACPPQAPRVAQQANYTALVRGAAVRWTGAWTGDDHTSNAAHPAHFEGEREERRRRRLCPPSQASFSRFPPSVITHTSLQICIGSSTQRKDDRSAVLGRRQQQDCRRKRSKKLRDEHERGRAPRPGTGELWDPTSNERRRHSRGAAAVAARRGLPRRRKRRNRRH